MPTVRQVLRNSKEGDSELLSHTPSLSIMPDARNSAFLWLYRSSCLFSWIDPFDSCQRLHLKLTTFTISSTRKPITKSSYPKMSEQCILHVTAYSIYLLSLLCLMLGLMRYFNYIRLRATIPAALLYLSVNIFPRSQLPNAFQLNGDAK